MSPTDHFAHKARIDLATAAVPVHPRPQVGALCWRLRDKDKAVQVLLITSRDTGRWIVPKGWVMSGKSPAQSALSEAWEEAGVIGIPSETPMGHFVYPKVLEGGVALPVRVALHPVEVTRLKRRYPEVGERERRWFQPKAAAEHLAEPDLAQLVASCAASLIGDHANR